MDPQPAIRHDDLLQQLGWVQALARSLVRDPNLAEDIAQQAWLTALERPPRSTSGPSLRAWLASVTRSLARQSMRSESRRSRREQRAAADRPAQHEAALDVVARGEIQRDLVGHVLGLDEPYRSVILMRYLDGLSGPEIADRSGASHAAVRKRLSRGLALLRARLDAAHDGDCRPLLAVFLLPALPSSQAPPGQPPTLAAPAAGAGPALGAAVALGLLVVAISVLGWWPTPDEPAVGGPSGPRLARDGPAALQPAPSLTVGPPTALSTRPGPPVAASPSPEAFRLPAAGVPVSGLVVDDQGRALGDVRVRFEPDSPATDRTGALTLTAFSDPDGRFEIPGVAGRGRVLVASGRWVTLVAGDAGVPLDSARPVVVAAPAGRLGGQILSSTGTPIPDARIQVLNPEDLSSRVGLDLASSWPISISGRSDAEGGFLLERLPRPQGARLRVAADGFRGQELPLPEDSGDLLVLLERPAGRLTGRVLTPDERPVAGARIGWAGQLIHAGDDGRFSLWHEPGQLDGPRTPQTLTVLAPDWAPLHWSAPRDADGQPVWPTHLDLRLQSPPASLEGQLVDAAGAPVPGAWVWLDDPTVLLAGEDGEASTERLRSAPPGAPPGPRLEVAEWALAGAPGDRWCRVLSDAEGRFRLEGLAQRPYRVAAMTRRSLVSAISPPVLPGAGSLRLQLPTQAVHQRLTGRVSDRSGLPLAGVLVETRVGAVTVAHTTWIATGRSTRTDAEGRFELGSAAAGSDVALRLDGPGLLPSDVPLPPRGAATDLELVASGRRDLRVLLDDPREADGVRVETRDGAPLPLYDLRHDRRRAAPEASLRDGRSARLSVADVAARLVLLRDGEPVRQVPLSLSPDRLTEIR